MALFLHLLDTYVTQRDVISYAVNDRPSETDAIT